MCHHPADHPHLQIDKATQGGHLSVLLIRLEQRFLDDLVHLSCDMKSGNYHTLQNHYLHHHDIEQCFWIISSTCEI